MSSKICFARTLLVSGHLRLQRRAFLLGEARHIHDPVLLLFKARKERTAFKLGDIYNKRLCAFDILKAFFGDSFIETGINVLDNILRVLETRRVAYYET